MIASIGCVSGDRRRRWVSRPAIRDLDIVDVDCGRLSVCISGVLNTVVSTVGEIWISGDQDTFAAAVLGFPFLLNAQVVAKAPVTVTNLFVSSTRATSSFRAADRQPPFSDRSACIVGKMGTISKNGTALPCHEGGSGTPPQGNDGRIYD